MVMELERGIQVHVELTTRLPDVHDDRKFLPTSYIISDVFNRTTSTPVNSRFLDHAIVRLQEAISSWFQHEKVSYVDYIRAKLGLCLEIRQESRGILKLPLESPTHGLASIEP